jgi:transposase
LTANIRIPRTRCAYARAAVEFFDWLRARGVTHISAVESVHVAAYIERLRKARSAPTANLRMAALRHLFDWLVMGRTVPLNPADDYIADDNPDRFVDTFVDGLDLKAAGFERVEAKATGRPGYAPGDLLKLYIYGYPNRVRSSRRLEAECHRNVEVIWPLRTLKPDFKTIADFRRENRTAFKAVFREFTLLCKDLKLFGRELLAVDGTRIKAVNNKDKNFTRNSLEKFIKTVDERLEEYLKRLDGGDVAEAETDGSRVKNLAEKIEAETTEPARAILDVERIDVVADRESVGVSHLGLVQRDSRSR